MEVAIYCIVFDLRSIYIRLAAPRQLKQASLRSVCAIFALKLEKKLGCVRGNVYFCIKSAAPQHLKRASLRSVCMIFAN